MQTFPKPLTKAETKSLIKAGSKVGQKAPQPYTGVEYGLHTQWHEGSKSAACVLVEPLEKGYSHIYVFSFKVCGNTCDITTSEHDKNHNSIIEDYVLGDKRGKKFEPTELIKECIEDFLASKNIGITNFIYTENEQDSTVD